MNTCNGLDDFKFWAEDKVIVGIDECGRGSIAGNLFIGLVTFKPNSKLETLGLNDSKKLSNKKRLELDDKIKEISKYVIIEINSDKINLGDNLNKLIFDGIREGLLELFEIAKLEYKNTVVFFDGSVKIPRISHIEQVVKPKFDANSWHVAAASILAKNAQVRSMEELDKKYPDYGFSNHNGYATAKHYENIKKNGILEIHRKNWIKL
jgi:ribonuclease HII